MSGLSRQERILIVDDEKIGVDPLQKYFSNEGYFVDTAASGEDGLKKANEHNYDLILTDLRMPGIDGLKMLEEIKKKNPKVDCIIITAYPDVESAVTAIDNKVLKYIKKPFDLADVKQTVKKCLKSNRSEKRKKEAVSILLTTEKELKFEVEKKQKQLNNAMRTTTIMLQIVEEQHKELSESSKNAELNRKRLKDANKRLEESGRYLEYLIDASPNCFVSTDMDQKIAIFNRTAQKVFGYSEKKVQRKPIDILYHNDKKAELSRQILETTLNAEHWKGEITCVRKNGGTFPAKVTTSIVANDLGLTIAIYYEFEDITEEKRKEEQLYQAEKLSILGQLAAKLAHEINNPSSAILAYVDLMLIDESLKVQNKKSLQDISDAVIRIKKLTQDLMEVARPAPMSFSQFSAQEPLEKACRFLTKGGETKFCKIVRDYQREIPLIRGDLFRLEQVFINLILNASQAMEGVKNKVLNFKIESDRVRGLVHIYVSDCGCGIPEQNLDRIFDHFFTTKEGKGGSGLGMPVVKSIVDKHNGTIHVDSEVGKETTFTISLPIVD